MRVDGSLNPKPGVPEESCEGIVRHSGHARVGRRYPSGARQDMLASVILDVAVDANAVLLDATWQREGV